MRAVLGLQPLTAGRIDVNGHPVRRGSDDIGYIPQQRRMDPLTPMRARDYVGQGLSGHRWGIGLPSATRRHKIAAALGAVGAAQYAHAPIGTLSGGEQQRVRVAQALVADPALLLCDEPLLSLVHNTIVAGAVLGVVGGLISVFVMMRDLPFAVHGISELSFAGASGFLLAGASVVAGALTGSIVAALLIGALGTRARDRNSIIGVLMPFGLGLGVLFLSLYHGRSANKFGLLTGQIAAVDTPQLTVLIVTAAIVVLSLLVLWRPPPLPSTHPQL